MKILVTGGAGFIGANFIIYWLNNHPNDTIINLDALTYAGNPQNLALVAGNPGYKFVKGNINDTNLVNKLTSEIDLIVNFAAETHVDRSIENPEIFLQTNCLGTHVLLRAALKNKVKRFHHISTDEVFGSLMLESEKKFDENSPYRPTSPYAASKASSDHLVNSFYLTYGLPITITNCSNNFGPFQHPEKFIPLTITNALENQKIPLYGDGANVRDWLYVGDHCRAIEKVLKEGLIGQTYCVGGMTKDISNIEIVKTILKIMKKDIGLLAFVKDRPGHDRKYAIDWSKINKTLGFIPQHTFEEWLVKTVEWYKTNIKWWKKLKNKDFQKYYKKQYPQL